MMIQMVIQLIQHHAIIVFLNRLSLGTNTVILFQEIAAEAAEPEQVVSIHKYT
jgi:hypothetical protein